MTWNKIGIIVRRKGEWLQMKTQSTNKPWVKLILKQGGVSACRAGHLAGGGECKGTCPVTHQRLIGSYLVRQKV